MRNEQSMGWMSKSTGEPGEDDLALEPFDGRAMLANMIGARTTELTGFSPSPGMCRDVVERMLAEAHAASKTVHLQVRW
jgi:hypothetical protein